MMHSFCNSTLPFSLLSRPSLGHYVFHQISFNFFWPLGIMGKSGNSTDSSRAEGLSAGDGSNSAIWKDSVRSSCHGSQLSGDNEGFIMVGSIRVYLMKWIAPYGTNVQSSSSSKPLVARRNSSTGSRSMSNPIPSAGTTIDSKSKNLCISQTNMDTYGVPSFRSSSENNSLYRRHHGESSFPSNFGKKSRVSYARRLHSAHRNSNYALADPKLDPLYIKPFDICLPGRQNSGLDVSLHANKESCTEMQEGVIEKRILRPGMVLLKHYITHNKQVELVKICRKLGLGPGGFYRPGYEGGAKLRLQMMCLGLDWDPQTRKYGNKRSIDGSEPPNIPHEFSILAKMAVEEAQHLSEKKFKVSNVEDVLPSMSPDICIVNFYTANGRLGLHQDRDESQESLRKGLPVVSFSVGDSAEFLYGDQRDVEKAEKVLLESGDVFIFGGESRHAFHGVSSIIPNSAPKELLQDTGLRPGRLNLTFRQF